jgi:repressor LexA
MTAATPRQREVLRLVDSGAALREIGAQLGIGSTNGVTDHLRALERKGLIHAKRGFQKSRRYALTLDGHAALGRRPCPTCDGKGHVLS